MLTKEENDRLTRVGPGTPMGELLRRYWHPILPAAQLPERGTKPVRILGEDLVLFRDRSGNLGLIGERCPHRRAGMVFGVPEQDGLRCAYHGWLWTADGRCIEQPFERTDDPTSTFNDRVQITAYPVQELAGLVFAYLGPEPAPLLPRWDLYVMDGVMREIGVATLPCNWLQVMENSLDPVHVEWLHTHFSNYVLERLDRPDLKRSGAYGGRRSWKHVKIGFDIFEHGIVKRRVLEGGSEEDDSWAIGHPILFPYTLRGQNTLQIRVPVDDTHTFHIWYACRKAGRGVEVTEQQTIPVFEVPVPGLDERGEPQWPLLDNNSGQDIAMWYTQGDITDRDNEHLAASDKGVALYRMLLQREMLAVQRGDDPMNVFRDPAKNVYLEIQTEPDLFGGRDQNRRLSRTGSATKYSPILQEALAKMDGEDALAEPVH